MKKKVVKKKEIVKKKVERIVKYVAIYNGPHKTINISPCVGRHIRGESFEVTKEVADTFKLDSNFIVKEEYV